MSTWIMFGGAATAVGTAAAAGGWWLQGHRRKRSAVYQRLAEKRRGMPRWPANLVQTPVDPDELALTFETQRIAQVDDFLPPDRLDALLDEALSCQPLIQRSYVPMHKQGAAVSYETLHDHGPNCLGLYQSPELHAWLSRLFGAPVVPTADHDQSSCSLLYYCREGDHIQWHYDHNFYRGRHFTVLLTLFNSGPSGGPSHSQLQHKTRTGTIETLATPANRLVAFEGSRVVHRVTPASSDDFRVVLSMTFSTDPRIHFLSDLARRVKDTSFFGARVLWD